jgi:hypothetical protein
MRARYLAVLTLILLASSGQTGQAVMRGGLVAIPSYENWKQVAAGGPCDKFEKDGHDVKVTGPLIVAGKTHEHHVITDEKLVEEIEERCPLKHG